MSLRRVYMSMNETETPADLRDGEHVEVIRLGGPRDGDRIGVYVVTLADDGSVKLTPAMVSEAREWAADWAAAFAARCDEVAAVHLVGSRATGRATADSDWDFIIVVEPALPGLCAFDGLTYGWLTREDAAGLGIVPTGVAADVYVMRTDESDADAVELFTREGVAVWTRERDDD